MDKKNSRSEFSEISPADSFYLENHVQDLKVVFQVIGQSIIILDPEHTILAVNPATVAATGLTEKELVGKKCYEIFHQSKSPGHGCPLARMMKSGRFETEEMEVEALNKTFLVSCTPVYDDAGTLSKIIHCATDVTDRKKADEVLRKTQKLETIGALAGGIAHDFNNLMGGIFGYIDMALDKSEDAVVSAYLSKAMHTIARAQVLTRQLLTMSKGVALERKAHYLAPFIQETVEFALSGSSVMANFTFGDNIMPCNIDRDQIGQAIENIIINAQQAMSGGGTIDISVENVVLKDGAVATLLAGRYVRISIRDRGVGIPQQYLSRIFDPFFTTKESGHGLGLSTAYAVISRHAGAIEVESEPGKGSTFHIYLPAFSGSVSGRESDSDRVHHRGTGIIVVMDDQEVVRDTLRIMLESFGYTVVMKKEGGEALRYVTEAIQDKKVIAAMVVDLTVPGGMGGLKTLNELRKFNHDIPVFVMSGYAEDPVLANPVEYGFSASICKPFRKSEVAEMLEKHFGKHSAG
ncbi:MAG: ATP-binding protein [Chitinispirillaceae bacterium]|jgi:PAS domain S-box-containing protein|nr:ATP-binding protein [Chitinispirillaceae bacterium]